MLTARRDVPSPMHDVSITPRLPTRCPMCKGGVIERTSNPNQGSFTWFHCLFCNHWWKFRVEGQGTNPNGELTGHVFVVAKSGTKHQLESVEVTAIPEDLLKKHLKSKTLQGETESKKLQRDIDRLAAMLRMAQAEDDRLWQLYQRDQRNAQHANAWSVAYNRAKELTQRLQDLQRQRLHLTSGDYFFEDLPSGISAAKTDANGKYALVIPRRGRYGIVARASRELFKETEAYFWIVWVTLGGQASKRLSLNNDNMLGAGSPQSALQ